MNKQNIIIAIYLNIGNLNPSEIDKYMQNYSERLKINNDQIEMHAIIIPIRTGETRIECLYPNYIVQSIKNDKIAALTEQFKQLNETLRSSK